MFPGMLIQFQTKIYDCCPFPSLFKARTATAKRKMIKKTYPFVETFYTEHKASTFFKNLYPISDQRSQKLKPMGWQ